MNKKILSYIFKKVSKNFKQGIYFSNGRNFSGRICMFHRGGRQRRLKIIDFKRRLNECGVICKIIYDANRSAYLGFVLYDNGYFSLIIIAERNKLGDTIFSGGVAPKNYYRPGTTSEVSNYRPFTLISCVEARPFHGAALARSAGVGAMLLHFNDRKLAALKLSSGWYVFVSAKCSAMLGAVSNAQHGSRILGKAGYSRGLGYRPIVRGVAMNPCDHPHGGGNGKTNTLALAVSP